MTTYKLTQDVKMPSYRTGVEIMKQGRILVKLGYDHILLATPTEPTEYISSWRFTQLSEVIEPTDLAQEKWVHPHLLKAVREKFLEESSPELK